MSVLQTWPGVVQADRFADGILRDPVNCVTENLNADALRDAGASVHHLVCVWHGARQSRQSGERLCERMRMERLRRTFESASGTIWPRAVGSQRPARLTANRKLTWMGVAEMRKGFDARPAE